MTRQAIQLPIKTYLGIAALLVVSSALVGSSPGSSSEEKKDKTEPGTGKNANEQIRREMEQAIHGIELEILRDDKWTKVERIEKPLLFHGDPTRGHERGSVWGWGTKGRPLALLELWQNANDRTRWAFALCNTSGGKLRARRAGAPWWHENDSATELTDIPGASPPLGRSACEATAVEVVGSEVHGP